MRNAWISKMLDWMGEHGFLPKPGERHLLAVSGGLDSVCLAQLYHAAGLGFGVVHCNFQLRGEESDADAVFVENLAKKLEVSFHSERFNTALAAETPQVSVQMAARELRYTYFSKIQQKYGYTHIATAHHADDAIETTLFNFSRGSGIQGLRSIPIKNGLIVRPLLAFSRKNIEEIAAETEIQWREDSSNRQDAYTRNFIRHHITPKFSELNPAFTETANKSIQRLRITEANFQAFLRLFIEQEVAKNVEGCKVLPFVALEKLPYPAELLYFWLEQYGFDEEDCRQLEQSRLLGQSGFECEGKAGFSVFRERQQYLLRSKQSAEFSIKINVNDLMVRLPNEKTLFMLQASKNQSFPDGKYSILVDAAALHFPLELRTWRAGDSFQPFGMEGKHQKVQDFLVNEKVSPSGKAAVLVLEDAKGQICWIVGYRMAQQLEIGTETKKLLKLVIN